MAYEKVTDLSTENVYKLGGVDSKTNKPNPTTMEGYYLGSKTVNTATGTSVIHVFQTAKGNTGAWGTADLNSKLGSVKLGTQTLIEYKGKKKLTGGKTKHMYDVSVDYDNTIEVAKLSTGSQNAQVELTDEEETDDTAEEGNGVDEDEMQSQALAAAERRAKVQALLNKKGKTA